MGEPCVSAVRNPGACGERRPEQQRPQQLRYLRAPSREPRWVNETDL
jgi:hypothetical protein